ncbi:uncharacterized protein LOC110921142 [Helianthus annuus]|uniref:uncharacterized protein LOC110921142 n=1 Tax=Helianthus annuus TaxID=4232 RepID=UPI000B8FBA5F|nr:uncharacterized protein LOC110921142 [Helianthus annuus]
MSMPQLVRGNLDSYSDLLHLSLPDFYWIVGSVQSKIWGLEAALDKAVQLDDDGKIRLFQGDLHPQLQWQLGSFSTQRKAVKNFLLNCCFFLYFLRR